MRIDILKSIRLAAMTGLMVIFAQQVSAQPYFENRVCRTNDMWVNINNDGILGCFDMMCTDPCPPHVSASECELPGGSEQEYLYFSGLWIGAKVIEDGVEQPRVSTGTDGWLNPAITEFWPGTTDSIRERSRIDTMNCLGNHIWDPSLPADDNFSMTFSDTLNVSYYVPPDPVDGNHFPLGIQVKADYFTMRSEACNHIYWIRYRIKNIGNHLLKDLYFGQYVNGGAFCRIPYHEGGYDDLTGYDTASQTAYMCENDGRQANTPVDSLVLPNVVGMTFLGLPPTARVSYNWWISNGDVNIDYGPAWSDYADRDSSGMGWTQNYGTPVGDRHRYDLLSNGEIDFDQVFTDSASWITAHPQNGHAWSQSRPSTLASYIANGCDNQYLLSAGPFGIQVGDHTELAPGDSIEVWMAYIGGMNLHNSAHPQIPGHHIDPTLFDYSDLRTRAAVARNGECFGWNFSAEPTLPVVAPAEFTLESVYPNPFNSSTMILFSLRHTALVEIAVYDVIGRKVESLLDETMTEGSHSLAWNAASVSSGIYFIRASAGGQAMQVQKAMLIK